MGMNDDGRMSVDKRGRTDETRWTDVSRRKRAKRMKPNKRTLMNIERNCEGDQTKLRKTSHGFTTDIRHNSNRHRTNLWWNGTDSDNVVEWSTSMSSATMTCKRKEIIIFLILHFFLYSLLFSKLLQGLLTTWLQAQKHTRIHSPYVNLKTHVQGKQMYVGLHHLVHI
jgi:hypothetical protein